MNCSEKLKNTTWGHPKEVRERLKKKRISNALEGICVCFRVLGVLGFVFFFEASLFMANLMILSLGLMTFGGFAEVVPKISFRLLVLSSSCLVSAIPELRASSWLVLPFPHAFRSWVLAVLPYCGCGGLGFSLVPVKPRRLGE